MKNPATIYETDTGEFAVVYDKEQSETFLSRDRFACHIYLDIELKTKKHHRAQLKHKNRLIKIVGYVD